MVAMLTAQGETRPCFATFPGPVDGSTGVVSLLLAGNHCYWVCPITETAVTDATEAQTMFRDGQRLELAPLWFQSYESAVEFILLCAADGNFVTIKNGLVLIPFFFYTPTFYCFFCFFCTAAVI